MFCIGDQVMYGNHGVCRIDSIQERTVDRNQVSYFVLMPLEQSQTLFYVPTHNQAALSKMRPLLSRSALLELLSSDALQEDCWIPEENRRKLRYKELVGSGDFLSMAQMVHTLHRQKRLALEAGRKFHLCDENFLRDAQRILESELSAVLQIPREQVHDVVQDRMKKNGSAD